MNSLILRRLSTIHGDTVIAALAGAFIIFLYTRHSGIGVSPDAVTYMSAAQNFHNHGRLNYYNGLPVVDFPVFYPVLLSIGIFLTSLNPVSFAPELNAILFAVVILATGYIMTRFRNYYPWYKRIVLSCIVLSPGLLEVYSMLWSETVFIALLLLFFMAFHRYLQSRSLASLLIMTLFAALAADTRFIGITLILSAGLFLLAEPGRPISNKWRPILLFSLGSLTLLGWNLVRNYLEMRLLTGSREKALNSLGTNLSFFGKVIGEWMIPVSLSRQLSILLAIFILSILILLLGIQLLKRSSWGSYERLALMFTTVYCVSMIIISTTSRFENLDSRLLSPVFIPLIWSLSWPFHQKRWKEVTVNRRVIYLAAGCIFFAMVQFNQLSQDYENYDGIKDAGVPGYNEDDWQQSPTIAYLKMHPQIFRKGYTVYSDADDAIFYLTGHQANILPHKDSPKEIMAMLCDPRYYVVWFTDGYDPDLINLTKLLSRQHLVCLGHFEDGSVYIKSDSLAFGKGH
jgi:hypothetical protein